MRKRTRFDWTISVQQQFPVNTVYVSKVVQNQRIFSDQLISNFLTKILQRYEPSDTQATYSLWANGDGWSEIFNSQGSGCENFQLFMLDEVCFKLFFIYFNMTYPVVFSCIIKKRKYAAEHSSVMSYHIALRVSVLYEPTSDTSFCNNLKTNATIQVHPNIPNILSHR